MKDQKRKTRSDKSPLTLHSTGQCCKKIKGKIHYFGTDKKRAIEKYLDQAAHLHGGRNPTTAGSSGTTSINELCDLHLRYQRAKVLAGALSPRNYSDQTRSLRQLVSFLGQARKIRNISTLDLQNYKRRLRGKYGSAHRPNLHLGAMKAMFHWARKNDILGHIPHATCRISRRRRTESLKTAESIWLEEGAWRDRDLGGGNVVKTAG